MKKHTWYSCVWDVKHIRAGEVIWQEQKENALANEGEQLIMNSYFRTTGAPTAFYARLANDTISQADRLVDIQKEPVGNGYAPILIERSSDGFSILLDNGVSYARSKDFTFTASGGSIGPVNTMYLATTSDNASTGKLVAYLGLSMNRTVLSGDSLKIAFTVKFINSPLLANQGVDSIIRNFFRGESVPANFYIRLANEAIVPSSLLSGISTEPAIANGYYSTPAAISAVTLPSTTVGFPVVLLENNTTKVTSKEYTITASGGDIGPASVAYLATTPAGDNTGLLIAFMNLPTVKTILDGTYSVDTVVVKLS